MENMGDRIRRLRKEKGLTLMQVGEAVGVGKSTVRKWEIGMIANMKRDKIAKLAEILGVTPGYLMGWKEPDLQITHPDIPDVRVEVDDRIDGYDERTLKRLLTYLDFFEKMNGGDES